MFQKAGNDGKRLLPNVRYNIPAFKVLNQNMLGGPWKEFISYHTSPDFYAEVAQLFAEAIRRFRPDLYDLAAKLQKIKSRGDDGADSAEVGGAHGLGFRV